MPTLQRRPATGVVRQLLARPQRYQLAQALRLLLQWLRRDGIGADQAFEHVLRFHNSVALNFPPSDIEALRFEPGSADGDWPQLHLTPALIGLLGVNGVLPYHYAERIASHEQRGKNACARAFLDTFSGRLVALHYQGWAKYRLEHALDVGGRDTLLPMLLALSGTRRAGPEAGVSAEVPAYYAGLLRQRPLSACAAERILGDYFAVPFRLEQCCGGWDSISSERQCVLGGPNATLGFSGALGERRWRHGRSLRLWIGPLNQADFARFLPGASAARALETMLALMGLAWLRCEAQLILKAACVGPVRLSARGRQRLGWDTFLSTLAAATDKADVRYTLHPPRKGASCNTKDAA